MGITKAKEHDALQEKLTESAAWWARKIGEPHPEIEPGTPGGGDPPNMRAAQGRAGADPRTDTVG